LHTAIPCTCAAARSIVFTPVPIFWISRSFGALAMISRVHGCSTCHNTSASRMAAAKSGAAASGQTVTSSPGSAASRARRSGPAA
jgi:hypothetical protein